MTQERDGTWQRRSRRKDKRQTEEVYRDALQDLVHPAVAVRIVCCLAADVGGAVRVLADGTQQRRGHRKEGVLWLSKELRRRDGGRRSIAPKAGPSAFKLVDSIVKALGI